MIIGKQQHRRLSVQKRPPPLGESAPANCANWRHSGTRRAALRKRPRKTQRALECGASSNKTAAQLRRNRSARWQSFSLKQTGMLSRTRHVLRLYLPASSVRTRWLVPQWLGTATSAPVRLKRPNKLSPAAHGGLPVPLRPAGERQLSLCGREARPWQVRSAEVKHIRA